MRLSRRSLLKTLFGSLTASALNTASAQAPSLVPVLQLLLGDDCCPDTDVGNRFLSSTPIAGYGGLIKIERGIYSKNDTGGVFEIYVGRFFGNSGTITIAWECLDGSRTVDQFVDGYDDLQRSLSFQSGEFGWKKITIPIQQWTLTDWDHLVFHITSVSINNGEPFYKDEFDIAYLQIDDGVTVNPNRKFVDKDHPQASDANPGTRALPYASLQAGIDGALADGRDLYIVPASTPYQELSRQSGSGLAGATINRSSGGAGFNDFFKIDKLPGANNPIIDNNHQTATGGQSAAPLYLRDGDSIWVRNLVGQNCLAGFITNPALSLSKLVFQEITSTRHIAGDNLGAIRIDNVSLGLIHNCLLGECYDSRPTSARNPYNDPVLTAGTYNGRAVYAWHAGVHGFRDIACRVEYSELFRCVRASFHKEQDDQPVLQSRSVCNNEISDCIGAVSTISNQGSRHGAQHPICVFNTVNRGVAFFTGNDGQSASLSQAEGGFIGHNSGYQMKTLVFNKGIINLRVQDNAISALNEDVGDSTNLVVGQSVGSVNRQTQFSSIKHNIYHSISPPGAWVLDRNGANELVENTFAGWQSFYSDHPVPGTQYLSENPDAGSSLANPGFADPGNGNFNRPANTVDGYLGDYPIGAKFDDETKIGPY